MTFSGNQKRNSVIVLTLLLLYIAIVSIDGELPEGEPELQFMSAELLSCKRVSHNNRKYTVRFKVSNRVKGVKMISSKKITREASEILSRKCESNKNVNVWFRASKSILWPKVHYRLKNIEFSP